MSDSIVDKSEYVLNRIHNELIKLNREVKVRKKDGTLENFKYEKIILAINKSAERVLVKLSDADIINICDFVTTKINDMGVDEITMGSMHSLVECALQQIDPQVALSYRNYRNYKQDFVGMLDKVYQ